MSNLFLIKKRAGYCAAFNEIWSSIYVLVCMCYYFLFANFHHLILDTVSDCQHQISLTFRMKTSVATIFREIDKQFLFGASSFSLY